MSWAIRAQDFPQAGTSEEQLTFLLRYAILAPSSHNTQPWLFEVEDNTIRLHADTSRWLRVADRDQRELHVSLGCTLENLLVAAEHFGFGHETTHVSDEDRNDLVATVAFIPDGTPASHRQGLFEALPLRHTNHSVYEARPVEEELLKRLHAAVVEEGVHLFATNDADIKRTVDALVARADAIQFADPEWRKELGDWLGRGVFGTGWLMSKMSQLAVTYLNLSESTAKKDAELLQSAPILAAISTNRNDRESQLRAGQVLERIWLRATTMGIRLHPMNQILQLPDLKEEVRTLLPDPSQHPQLTFRMGYAEAETDHTPRRPLDDVLI